MVCCPPGNNFSSSGKYETSAAGKICPGTYICIGGDKLYKFVLKLSRAKNVTFFTSNVSSYTWELEVSQAGVLAPVRSTRCCCHFGAKE